MNKIYLYIIIFLIIVIAIFSFIFFLGKNRFDKEVKESKEIITTLNSEINELKEQKRLSEKELEKMSKKEVIVYVKKVEKSEKKAIEIAEDCTEQLKKTTKQLEKCNKSLKMKDILFITGIMGIGVDQEFNMTGQAGGTINGKIYDGLFTRIYLGGGGTYTFRTDFKEMVNGGNFIFQVIFKIGK